MKVKDYEFEYPEEDYNITKERREEIMAKLKDRIRKGSIGHFRILEIGKNQDEYNFIYETLLEMGVTIRGTNVTTSGELKNFRHIPRVNQTYIPPILDEDEQAGLFLELHELKGKLQSGDTSVQKRYDEVREKLIVSNMRYARWIANRPSINALHIPLEDKYQMSMMGLIKAIDRYDPTFGAKFSTYAFKPIRHQIVREFGYTYHLPYSQIPDYKPEEDPYIEAPVKGGRRKITARKLADLSTFLEAKNGIIEQFLLNLNREPSEKEISEILNMDIDTIRDLESIREFMYPSTINAFGEVTKKISFVDPDLRSYFIEEEELEERPQDDSSTLATDSIESKTEDCAMVLFCREELLKQLKTLTEREELVLRERFALNGGLPKTQDTIGHELGISGGRVSDIEHKGIRKMRHPARAKYFRDFNSIEF